MSKTTQDQPAGSFVERRGHSRSTDARWRTSLTLIEKNRIQVRGYSLDEMMGRVSFGEAVYLLLVGELPTPTIGRMMEAILVSSIDHGVTPPSTLAARNVATTGAPLRACAAAGVLGFGKYHGGDIGSCLRFLDEGLRLVRAGVTYGEAASAIAEQWWASGEPPPGFGHRLHTHDPRAARLFQMALELELDGEHVQMARAIELVLCNPPAGQKPMPLNVDGAIAAVCGDVGLDAELGNALFLISRVPGLIAQAYEEQTRFPPMRQIDPKDHVYDGPGERRLPETRK